MRFFTYCSGASVSNIRFFFPIRYCTAILSKLVSPNNWQKLRGWNLFFIGQCLDIVYNILEIWIPLFFKPIHQLPHIAKSGNHPSFLHLRELGKSFPWTEKWPRDYWRVHRHHHAMTKPYKNLESLVRSLWSLKKYSEAAEDSEVGKYQFAQFWEPLMSYPASLAFHRQESLTQLRVTNLFVDVVATCRTRFSRCKKVLKNQSNFEHYCWIQCVETYA